MNYNGFCGKKQVTNKKVRIILELKEFDKQRL